jgi:hypothetical protein
VNTVCCEWCRRRIQKKRRGTRFCSASCRQRAYERRQEEKRKQAEVDAINAKYPPWAVHLHVKPKLPPRRRPTRLRCPVCTFSFVVKKRGPIPETCSERCARALMIRRVVDTVREAPVALLNQDMMAMYQQEKRRRRFQAIIADVLAPVNRRRK